MQKPCIENIMNRKFKMFLTLKMELVSLVRQNKKKYINFPTCEINSKFNIKPLDIL